MAGNGGFLQYNAIQTACNKHGGQKNKYQQNQVDGFLSF